MSYSKLLHSVFLFLSFASFSFSYSSFNATTPKCSMQQTVDLLNFKQSLFSINESTYDSICEDWLGSDYYPIMMNWNTSRDCCKWNGVTCDQSTGDVTGIDLSCGKLKGTIHTNSSLFNLPHLKRLNLAWNGFYPSKLPSQIGRLSNSLTHLNLSNCGFNVSMDITLLHKLVSLDLSVNVFDFIIGPHFFKELFRNFTNLEQLSLESVDISTVLPASLNLSSSLKLLNLASTGLQGIMPPSIFQLQSLETLDLSENSLTGYIPWEISLLTNLVSLRLSMNDNLRIQPHIFGGLLKNSTLLRDLSLAGVHIGSVLPTYLDIPYLKSLDLRSTGLRGILPNNILNLQYLEVLDLSQNINLTGPLPKSLVNLTRLTYLDLSGNKLNRTLPSWLFTLSTVKAIYLEDNMFSGDVPFESFALPSLERLYLSHNQLVGHIDVRTFRKLTNLSYLDLSFNNFRGDWELDTLFISLTNLRYLDLSYSGFSVTTKNDNHYVNPGLWFLKLASCKLKVFPKSFRAMNQLEQLDLSSNEIHGRIPLWAGEIGGSGFSYLNLSHNFITSLPISQWYQLIELYLQSNQIEGPFPLSICNLSNLRFLDISNNSFNGVIPQCMGNVTSSLALINFGNNRFQGTIPHVFNDCGQLEGLILNGNQLEGGVPSSLLKCQLLKVVDLGNNQLNGTFPDWLGELPNLQVLVLKLNKFHGIVGTSSSMKLSFPSLRVLDLSHNGFASQLPQKYFQNFNAMKNFVRSTRTQYLNMSGSYYSVTMSVKGQQLQFPKISIEYIIVDLSSNRFDGEIPNTIGNLTSLIVLNLSHNSFTGRIPHALGNLIEIESLDLSSNQLTGDIPENLAKITTLAVLNLSQNDLMGRIPNGPQFSTFEGNSFGGNPKLCGTPLPKKCSEPSHEPQLESDEGDAGESGFTWEVVMLGYGCGTVLGLVMGYFMLSTRKVKWFNAIADLILKRQ
ncbi:leucine-rich repeat-containing protein [Tanacetum coccineum]